MKEAGHIAILACAAALAACDDCPDTFELREQTELEPGQRVVLTVSDGELSIAGRERTTALEIEATGCVAGSEPRIAFDSIEGELHARLHASHAEVRVRLPAGVPIEVRHGTGAVRWRGTGSATLNTGAGRTVIGEVIGDVRVTAGPGALYVRQVLGDVEVVDGAGPVFVADIAGGVRVRDGAGGIHIRNVEGDVVIDADGAGSIDVREIGGDFIVRAKSADPRLIRYDSVSGRTRLPSDLLPP